MFKNNNNLQQDLAYLATKTQDVTVSDKYVSDFKLNKVENLGSKQARALYDTLNDRSLVIFDLEKNTARLVDQSNKRSKIQFKLDNPAYLFPTNKDDIDCWRKIIALAEKIRDKNLFIVKDPKLTPELEKTIHDEEKQLDSNDKQLEKYMYEENKLIKPNSPKRWKIQIDGSSCHILMVQSTNEIVSFLTQRIGKISAKIINSFSIKKSNEESAEILSENVRAPNVILSYSESVTEANGDGPVIPGGKDFYPDQIKYAEKLLEQITKKMKKTSQQEDNNDFLSSFKDFEFLILLPDRVNLEEQTKDRLIKIKEQRHSKLTNDDLINVIRINDKASVMQKKWKDFIHQAEKNPWVLHLVIHDECHWAAGEKQTSYRFMGFEKEKRDYHYQRNGTLLPNLFTVLISATPYNFFACDWLQEKHMINWKTAQDYKGLKALKDAHQIITTECQNEAFLSHCRPLLINGYNKDFLLVLLDYMDALLNFQSGNSTSTPTRGNIKKCIRENKLVVLRLGKAKNEIRQTSLAKAVLVAMIKSLNLNLEVWINSSKKVQVSNFIHKVNEEKALSQAQMRDPKITNKNFKDKMVFSDIENIPMIMIVIERGRMGDTFPQNCIAFDLRARYLKQANVKNFTSIIQDVGRAFGYGERPTLILSREANIFLEKVWDFSTDSLSWDYWQSAECSQVLGYQMKKIKEKRDNFIELSEDEGMIELIQSMYEVNKKKPVFLYHLGASAFEHRIILKAEPQIGKTGTFLYLIDQLSKKIRKILPLEKYWFENFTKQIYYEKTLDEIELEFQNPEGEKEYQKYIEYIKEERKKGGIPEPSEWAAKSLSALLSGFLARGEKIKAISIADFGCVDLQFAKHLADEIEREDSLKQIQFVVYYCYEISTNRIENMTCPSNMQIQILNVRNCGMESNFEAENFDYVVSVCALWGAKGSWMNILKTALHALKPNGTLIVAESKKLQRLTSDIFDLLENCGVRCTAPQPFMLEIKRKFSEHYREKFCQKSSQYDHQSLGAAILDL